MKQTQLLLRYIWVGLAVFNGYSKAGENILEPPSNIQCACSNEVLRFNCTVIVDGSGGATIWTGTAFTCGGNNEILLRHNNFNRPEGTSGECNGDTRISARSVGVEGNCYTSELSVMLNGGLSNRTIRCVSNLNSGMNTIGTAMISLTTGPYQRAPTNITLISVHPRELTFNWSQLDSDCPSVQYVINSDCGNCFVGGDRSATCSNLQLSATERNCTFSVGSVICGFTGPPSNPVTVTLKVPDAPQVNFIPVYSGDSQALLKLVVEINKMGTFSIYEGISGSVVNYTIHFSSGANKTRTANCTDSVCEYTVEVPSTECQSSSEDSMVSVSVANRLGPGQSSEPISVGCTNKFVKVDSTASTLTCIFQNDQKSVKTTCSVEYSICDQDKVFYKEGNNTLEFPDRVTLEIKGSDCYTYTIIASDGTKTVMVEGRVDPDKSDSSSIAVAVIVPIFFVLILGISILSVIFYYVKKRRRSSKATVTVKTHQDKGTHIKSKYTESDGNTQHTSPLNEESIVNDYDDTLEDSYDTEGQLRVFMGDDDLVL